MLKAWIFTNIIIGIFFFNLIRLKTFDDFVKMSKVKNSVLVLTGLVMLIIGIFQTASIAYVSGYYSSRHDTNHIYIASIPTILLGFIHILNAIWPLRSLSTIISIGYLGNSFGNFGLAVGGFMGKIFGRTHLDRNYVQRTHFIRAQSYDYELGKEDWLSPFSVGLCTLYFVICIWSAVLTLTHFNMTFDVGIPDWMRKASPE